MFLYIFILKKIIIIKQYKLLKILLLLNGFTNLKQRRKKKI